MAKKTSSREGLQEDRTRVTLFLPVHKTDDIRAVRLVIGYLRRQRTVKDCKITGFTFSMFPNAAFFGIWWSSKRRKWIPEKVALIIMDYHCPIGEAKLDHALGRLKHTVHRSYAKFGRPQDVVWIIAEQVMRFA
jgi:hypothetical protein